MWVLHCEQIYSTVLRSERLWSSELISLCYWSMKTWDRRDCVTTHSRTLWWDLLEIVGIVEFHCWYDKEWGLCAVRTRTSYLMVAILLSKRSNFWNFLNQPPISLAFRYPHSSASLIFWKYISALLPCKFPGSHFLSFFFEFFVWSMLFQHDFPPFVTDGRIKEPHPRDYQSKFCMLQNRPYNGRHSLYENSSTQYRGSTYDISGR